MPRAAAPAVSAIALMTALAAGPAFAQIVSAGTTATSVATAPSGRLDVSIAPPNAGGTSVNHYSAFSVPQAGASLDNRQVGANTIVNEVRGTGRSFLNGQLEVLGSRAHVVLVNPNGVTVDGGSFVNVGGVALGAGTIRYDGSEIVLGTGTGDIDVTGQGLSGTITSLQLVAGRLRIDGPVANLSASPNADISLVAGTQDVALDSTLPASSTLRPWASRRDLGGQSNEILIDVTPRGSLSASRVQMSVSSRGAGVSFAGRGQASIGEFSISSRGRVSVLGGSIQAERTVKIAAASIEILNAPAGQGDLRSLSGAVTLLAQDGDLDLRGSVTGARRDAVDADSRGAVTLAATGDIRLLSESADRLAIAFASDGDLAVKAGGALTNNTGRLISNANTAIEAASVANTVDRVGTQNGGAATLTVLRGRSLWPPFFGRRKTKIATIALGDLRLPNQLAFIVGKSVEIRTGELRNSGEIDALDGPMTIDATRVVNIAVGTGTFSIIKRCGFVCHGSGVSGMAVSGGSINAALGLRITASESILNEGGQIVAYGNMELDAPSIVARAVYVPTVSVRPAHLRNLFDGPVARPSFANAGGQFVAPLGTMTIRASAPVSLEGGDLVAGNGLDNPAGVVGVAGGNPFTRVGADQLGLLRSWFE